MTSLAQSPNYYTCGRAVALIAKKRLSSRAQYYCRRRAQTVLYAAGVPGGGGQYACTNIRHKTHNVWP